MSLLCPFSFPAGFWCSPRAGGQLVLFVPSGAALPVGFAAWFRSSGGAVRASQPYRGGVALLLVAPDWLRSALRECVPPPASHGSRTAGVDLAW